ncbi:hypothetical protein [Thermus albus]|uniref:hypothetical protein n=1 Tax=Thermus albus TaxID=2908146 RepID=UPI001FA95C35|nr:hypothetical protein [Thermus albus]
MKVMETEVLFLEDVLEDMARELKETVNAPEGARTYRLWGMDTHEVETALYDMMKHLSQEERDLLRKYLPNMVETIHRKNYNVVVLLPTEKGLHAKGANIRMQRMGDRIVS